MIYEIFLYPILINFCTNTKQSLNTSRQSFIPRKDGRLSGTTYSEFFFLTIEVRFNIPSIRMEWLYIAHRKKERDNFPVSAKHTIKFYRHRQLDGAEIILSFLVARSQYCTCLYSSAQD